MTGTTFATAPTADLTRRDRCDRCGARAFVRATFPAVDGLELLFCGHHFREHEPRLVAVGADIHDERDRLYEQASAPEA